ncbi:MAG TPA: hypothetical protein VK464_00065, partial [Symbiobacteriaceae bacterium]|nr:hypothetical protein [Symbiobacteriaceae bacterium]
MNVVTAIVASLAVAISGILPLSKRFTKGGESKEDLIVFYPNEQNILFSLSDFTETALDIVKEADHRCCSIRPCAICSA